ncbi:suppressor of cytokine signaling 4 [Engraulis encrasicolus]|uniref:suppressor of cytokine signaling 4 n=1 Tax=Engraulis encrasicolus TaxID=184585 RepID=UPI002FD354A2
MSEKKSRTSDTRPKSMRSWSADSYVWSRKKRSRASRENEGRVCGGSGGVGEDGGMEGSEDQQGAPGAHPPPRSASCSRRRRDRDRKCSCSLLAADAAVAAELMDVPCRKALSRRSLRQKFQDAMGQCLPLRTHHHHHHCHHHHHHHHAAGARPLSVLLWSKRKIHVSELMEDKCPFSPKSELAQCWHLIKKHGAHGTPMIGVGVAGAATATDDHNKASYGPPSSPPALISWEEVSSGGSRGGCCPSQRTHSLDDWDPSCRHGSSNSGGTTDTGSSGLGLGLGLDDDLDLEDCCPGDTDYILVPDLLAINNSACYWGVLDRFQAEALLEGQPEGTFLLRDSAQDEFLFSVSFRRYSRSLHARIEQNGKRFSFDGRDPCMYQDASVTGLLRHYADPAACLFFEPLLSRPLPRTFPFSLQHLCRAVVCSCTTYQGVEALPLPWALRDYLRQYHFKCNDDGACSV